MHRPLLVREARIPRTSAYVIQKQLGVLGVAMVALLFISTGILTTAFLMFPPRSMATPPVLPVSMSVAPPDQGIWVRTTHLSTSAPLSGTAAGDFTPSASCVR